MHIDSNSISVSRFLLPFHFLNRKSVPFKLEDFTEYEIRPKYLVESVCELFRNGSKAECKCYYLNSEWWKKYDLPARFSRVKLKSYMTGCNGTYDFIFTSFRLLIFNTGIGFLELEIKYLTDDANNAADIGFCLSNVFTNEHDSGKQENRLEFSYSEDDQEIAFSLKNALYKILNAHENEKMLKLFPSNSRKKLLVYHSIIGQRQDNLNKMIYALCNGLHKDVFYDEAMDDDVMFSSVLNQTWGISSAGIASVAYPDSRNRNFIEDAFKRNTLYDYYYVFLLVLHEREVLLKYNHNAVVNKSNPKALIEMKKDLLKIRVLYTYNTVSTESSYQRFYEGISQKFNISCLEDDIQDVVEAVESHVNDKKDRKVNTILTALSLLAIFSILTDGLALADRLQSGDVFGGLQWGVIGVVVIIVAMALVGLFRRG